jgi:REP element-mobilizing transposase RayT
VSCLRFHATSRSVVWTDVRRSRRTDDRQTYLRLLRDNLGDAEARLLGWRVMSSHVHLIAVPGREDSLGVLFRRVLGKYARYCNVRRGRTGHLWQNRFFCISLSSHEKGDSTLSSWPLPNEPSELQQFVAALRRSSSSFGEQQNRRNEGIVTRRDVTHDNRS